jgi:hypothetical protein
MTENDLLPFESATRFPNFAKGTSMVAVDQWSCIPDDGKDRHRSDRSSPTRLTLIVRP